MSISKLVINHPRYNYANFGKFSSIMLIKKIFSSSAKTGIDIHVDLIESIKKYVIFACIEYRWRQTVRQTIRLDVKSIDIIAIKDIRHTSCTCNYNITIASDI